MKCNLMFHILMKPSSDDSQQDSFLVTAEAWSNTKVEEWAVNLINSTKVVFLDARSSHDHSAVDGRKAASSR